MNHIYATMGPDQVQRVAQRMRDNNAFIEDIKTRAAYYTVLPGGWRFVFKNVCGELKTFDYWPTRGKWCEHRYGKQYHRQGESALRQRLDALGVERLPLEPLDAGLRRILARTVHCGQ